MSKKTELSAEEIALFRRSVADVKPIQQDKRAEDRPRTTIRRKKTAGDEASRLAVSYPADNIITSEQVLFYAKSGLQHKLLNRFKRGQIPIQAKLDLHSLNSAQAEAALIDFIDHCQQQHFKCVLIIHGKGHLAKSSTPVLKNLTYHLLNQHPATLAISSAQAKHGGTGAVYLLLKST